ncbi:MAG TPA: IS30 family transposase [Prolixibacteraceae bacterium]|nr:IS30 family transposase [Prolixibacteraceae bacterium]
MKNKQLTSIQRNQIEVLLKTNTPIKRVAQLLETDKSTIYREINRNKKKRSYSARFAQELCTERKERSGRARKFTDQAKNFVIEKLKKEQWSPNQIVGFARLNNIPMVSHERIYQFIRKDKKEGGMLWTHIRHKLKHHKRPVTGKHVNIKNKVSIELRPTIVDTQERYGDWEIDTIIGENQKGAILTITERKTAFLLMEKIEFGKLAEGLAKAAIRMLFAYKNTVHTITSDNGSEFAQHELMAKKAERRFLFCTPILFQGKGIE